MSAVYNHADYAEQDIARHERARREYLKKYPGQSGWYHAVGRDGVRELSRVLTRSPKARASRCWNLADQYKKEYDHFASLGWRCYVYLWDEEDGVDVRVGYEEFAARLMKVPGRDGCPNYWVSRVV